MSRGCFPIALSEKRRAAIVKAAGCNALVVFPGNFGPETPETLITKYSDGPCMFAAAAFDHHGRALKKTYPFAACERAGTNGYVFYCQYNGRGGTAAPGRRLWLPAVLSALLRQQVA